jgi:tRNA-specific 2-thiouridylase
VLNTAFSIAFLCKDKIMKILIGMSGGLDSTYAALKLIKEGHEVVGAIGVMHSHTDLESARDAAVSLGIPLVEIDAREKFCEVKKNFVDEYSKGRTPNPCILCNPLVKFRVLADYAKENGFDRIATGHYANIVTVEDNGQLRYTVKRAKDSKKDQTYMLHRLPQDILSILYLPLADEVKADVREKAKAEGLKAAEQKESQEICFIPDGDYASYIENLKGKFKKGNFVLENGTVLGQHNGIVRYTVGQRKGLGISYGERLFVSKIDAAKNEIVLSGVGSYTDTVSVSDIVFTGMAEPKAGEERRVQVKLRYLASPVGAVAVFDGMGGATLKLDVMQKAVTPGQSAVMYSEDILLCGGFIN